MTRPGWIATLLAALLGATMLAGCSGDDSSDDDGTLTVWSLENQADRVAATQKVIAEFTKSTGIKVKYVGIDENQFSKLITAAAAGGDLPDVMGAIPLSALWSLNANELLDTGAANDVLKVLGTDTFNERALTLTKDGDKPLGVPSDAWAQLLFYRTDLFRKAGLDAPDTYRKITAAARKLTTGGQVGITSATVANDAFTAQTFEHLALGNGCEMVDDSGKVTIGSKQCVDAFSFYQDLISSGSVKGAQSVDSTRATYFSGRAAMVIWSSFLLDELAGLRADALPNCPQCKSDPTFLAKNTGVVTAIEGTDSPKPAQFGEVVSWAISATAQTDDAKKFVQFMMSSGYTRWLGQAPEGKVPVRTGDSSNKNAYVDAWRKLPAGVDKKAPLATVYPAALVDQLVSSVDTFDRWGIEQGQGKLVGAALGELPVAKAVNALTSGQIDASEAAKRCDDQISDIKKSLE
ncbi:ABC transporter substrate-binding protein [Cryptosporangium phraense]|uniref:Extracellular solute-binding protein n=1 Tax=Cryptosporangium phraense TaxID=2593070 RepID=A0A545AQC0_9ACTN|nr:extracellular solute-binding protein [Cryptosporangium phraense]TQS43519.1 extracellular solute-binding protein [Cryptosporangium phraense]